MNIVNKENFIMYAAKHYDNPHCQGVDEFYNDLKRFDYVAKLFSKYKKTNEIKERLVLNHIIIIFNLFGPKAVNMLFHRFEDNLPVLIPFVSFLNYLPVMVAYDDKVINTTTIEVDEHVKSKIYKI